jgi:hypothetical protein
MSRTSPNLPLSTVKNFRGFAFLLPLKSSHAVHGRRSEFAGCSAVSSICIPPSQQAHFQANQKLVRIAVHEDALHPESDFPIKPVLGSNANETPFTDER